MPKTKPLIRDMASERSDFRRRLIKSKAYMRGYKTQKELAQAMGENGSWLCRRLSGEAGFELEDAVRLDNILRFSAEEMAQLVRGR